MSDILKRAELMFEQGRFGGALESYQEFLMENPEDAHALCMAARCFLRLEIYGKASEYASAAIAAEPDYSYAYYIQSFIYYIRNLDEEAREAIDTALEMKPTDPDYHVMLGRLHAKQADWLGAKDASDMALEHSPYHSEALTLRAGALVKLRQYDEAEHTLRSVLENDPENESALNELGYLHLHRSEWKKALEVFQSSLMVDPESSDARDGLMMALRAQFPVYGLILRYFLWLSGFSKKYQQAVVYGATALGRLLGIIQKEYPALAPIAGLILLIWRVFAYLTWTIRAGTTLLLRFNKYGKNLVNRDEVLESNIVGALWAGALVCWLYHYFVDPFTLFCRVGIPVFLTLPLIVGGTFSTVSYGWPKYLSRAILAVMGVSGLLGLLLYSLGQALGITLLIFYFNSFGYVLLVLAFLESAEPTKD